MASKLVFVSFLFVLSICIFGGFKFSEAHKAPAMHVFGDSSRCRQQQSSLIFLEQSKFSPLWHRLNFQTRKQLEGLAMAKTQQIFLEPEKVGVPTPPPYLSLISQYSKNTVKFQTGVNFASAGSGILNQTNNIMRQSISLTQQVDYFSEVHESLMQQLGHSGAHKLLPKSIFAIVIGSTDISAYSRLSNLRSVSTPEQYVRSMVNSLGQQIERLYSYHARKFVIVGVGAIGCTPSQRVKKKSQECNLELNNWSHMYHHALSSKLNELKSKLKNFNYYFNAHSATQDIIKRPTAFGFQEVKAACCGLGVLNAQVPCLPITKYCSNRNEFVIWDADHPTEALHRVLVDNIYNNTSKYTFSMSELKLLHV